MKVLNIYGSKNDNFQREHKKANYRLNLNFIGGGGELYVFLSFGSNSDLHSVNVSILIKFSQKDQCFYVNYHKFSMKSCVLDVY